MRRLALVILLAAGCPLFEDEARTTPSPVVAAPSPSPASRPATPTSRPAGHPGTSPTSQPAGDPLLLDLEPGVSAERDGVSVTVERLRIQPCTAEALAAEPGDVGSQAADGAYFLALTLAVTRDGEPYFALEGDEGELSLRAVALLHGVESVVVPAGWVEPADDREDAIYLWRPITPPVAVPGPLVLRVLLSRDDGDDIEVQLEIARAD